MPFVDFKCLFSISLPLSSTPPRFTQAHSWGAETNSIHTIRCLRRYSHVFPISKRPSSLCPCALSSGRPHWHRLASCPLMRARKKYSVKEVWRLKEQAVIYQAENHSSFTGEHVRWRLCDADFHVLPLSALWWSCWLQSSCAVCLLSSLVDADFEHCLKWQATHTHTHTALQNETRHRGHSVAKWTNKARVWAHTHASQLSGYGTDPALMW